jgi:hypothetical protein
VAPPPEEDPLLEPDFPFIASAAPAAPPAAAMRIHVSLLLFFFTLGLEPSGD